MVYKGALRTDTFIKFLRRLIKDNRRKVFLIVDNLRVHHATRVQEWITAHREDIELFFLPPYSPEHHPDEYLHHDIKTHVRQNSAPRSDSELTVGLTSYMWRLQPRTDKITRFFEHDLVAYAKA